MVSFLFWNVGRRDLRARIARLAELFVVDFLLLAECDIPEPEILAALNSSGAKLFCYPPSDGSPVRLFTRLRKSQVVEKFNDGYVGLNIREIRLGGPAGLLLASVHYPSKLQWEPQEQLQGAIRHLAPGIRSIEEKAGHERTILVGDLNMNPFEPGVTSAFGLHAVMTRDIARREERTVAGTAYPFFYNPMWGHHGDTWPGPPGTYYLSSGKPENRFWNMYDQVLLRPDLMNKLTDLKIVDHDGAESLVSKSGLPWKSQASDHLPIFFRLNM